MTSTEKKKNNNNKIKKKKGRRTNSNDQPLVDHLVQDLVAKDSANDC